MANDIIQAIESMGEAERRGALAVLDMLSHPLTKREIEGAMIGRGVSRSQRKILAAVVEPLHIIALAGPERGNLNERD